MLHYYNNNSDNEILTNRVLISNKSTIAFDIAILKAECPC